MEELWVWLTTRKGLDGQQLLTLLDDCGGLQAVFRKEQQELEALGLDAKAVESLCDKSLRHARSVCDYCEAQGIRLLSINDQQYPARLRSIAQPPVLLYCKGTLPQWNEVPMIGVVGTRNATSYGKTASEWIAKDMAEGGAILVSGMAKGIDAWATESALEAGGMVIGVLGCGIDRIYPAENRELYRKMEKKGCLISEYPPGTAPARWFFPQRNRIISGLSNGVVVVEAPLESGALITARQALEQGRDVFAVPSNIDSAAGEGSNQLLRSGAVLVTGGWDILSEYVTLYPDKITQQHSEKPLAADKKTVDNRPVGHYSDGEISLTEQERTVLAALKPGRQNLDDLLEELDMLPSQVMSVLTVLSVKGLVSNLPGGIVEKL